MSRLPPLLVCAALAAAPLVAAEAPIELEAYNRTYTDLVGELEPYVADPVRVRLSSPSQSLTVRGNRIHAEPTAGGTLVGRLELDVLGKGALVADVDLGGIRQTFDDEILLPPQTLVVAGRARVERAAGGYRVTVLELPERVRVAVQSRLAVSVLNLCGSAELLTLGAVSCAGLEEALTRPAVPLPRETGEVFLPDTELGAEERARLDRLIAAAR